MATINNLVLLLLLVIVLVNFVSADDDDDDDDDDDGAFHAQAIDDRERRLRDYEEYLYRLEKHLDEREAYLRENFCPESPQPFVAGLCEYCAPGTRCASGLTCRDRLCQQTRGPNPVSCPFAESCGPGQKRECKKIRPSMFQESGELKKRLVNNGFFIGRTGFIPNCVNGKVRINCAKRKAICKNEFCITMTLKECRTEGLDGSLTGRDESQCCVKIVPVDCFMSELCRCIARSSV